ncbi:MAG: hypothetical protein D4S00_07630 [Streptomycetaceae bacterium]|nr:MAG: hypothetical protein D4S00_07630 [Streptomycetaceae bacterium]
MTTSLSFSECIALLPPSRHEALKNEGATILADWIFTTHSGVLIFQNADTKFIAPYVRDPLLRRAHAGDGVSIALLNPQYRDGFSGSLDPDIYRLERALAVDQTNESLVLDEKTIVKWQLSAELSVGAIKEKLLDDAGFVNSPKLLGTIFWQNYLIASANAFIQGSQDGWTWCVEMAKTSNNGQWVTDLADLTAHMHTALGGQVHGDFHVGQILKTPGSPKLWVIDFDGDPLTSYEEKIRPVPLIHDVASMCCSFFHVGAVAIKYGAALTDVKDWIVICCRDFTNRYFEADQSWTISSNNQIHQYMWQLEYRELTYANEFLPQWRYAPEFAMEFMEELGYGSH